MNRYEVRHNNQVWHVFDTDEYAVIESFPANHKHEAMVSAIALNLGLPVG